MRPAAIVLACLACAEARADRQPAFEDVFVLVRVASDEHRWELGAGATTGWRDLVDLHARYYAHDTVTIGPRLRFDPDGTPRVALLELSKAIAVGKPLFAESLMLRVKLAIEWGDGVARVGDRFGLTAFVGLSWRIQPGGAEWLLFDLRARATLSPELVATAARATLPPEQEIELVLGAELGASVSVLWPPRAKRRCLVR